jgi:TRAP-type C4-dicarboxylate transport system permease small subunit
MSQSKSQPQVKHLIESHLAVACMVLLVAITISNVLVRYFTNESFAWTEEISIYLMVLMTFCGAASVARRDAHIRVEFFYEGGSAQRQKSLRLVSGCCTVLLFACMALLLCRAGYDEWKYQETTMALQMPRWMISAAVAVLCMLAAVRAFAWTREAAKHMTDEGGAA